jgi:hypothetical protein
MEIIIGREAQSNQLLVIADGKAYRLDVGGNVPNSVSRYNHTDGTAHCRIIISTGGMRVENLNEMNVTYVNGEEVESSKISQTSVIELGEDQYRINLSRILKLIGYQPTYSTKHLRRVWERYDKALLRLQLEDKKKQNQQKLQGILSQVSMLCVIIPSVMPTFPIPSWLRCVLVIGALGMGIYFYLKGNQTDDSFIIKKRELDEQFKEDYLCPNPKCKTFLGFTPYDTLKSRKRCGQCNCNYQS